MEEKDIFKINHDDDVDSAYVGNTATDTLNQLDVTAG